MVSAPTSLPACGSVRFIVPDHCAVTRCGSSSAFHRSSRELAEHVDGALRQQRRECERLVGRAQHLLDREADGRREAAPAVLGVAGHPAPPRVDVLLVRLRPTVGRAHRPVGLQRRTLLVTDAVEGREHVRGEPAGFLEHASDRVGIRVRERLVSRDSPEIDDVVEDEVDVLERRPVVAHDAVLSGAVRIPGATSRLLPGSRLVRRAVATRPGSSFGHRASGMALARRRGDS